MQTKLSPPVYKDKEEKLLGSCSEWIYNTMIYFCFTSSLEGIVFRMNYIYQIFLTCAAQSNISEGVPVQSEDCEYVKLRSDLGKQCFLDFHLQEIFTYHSFVIA